MTEPKARGTKHADGQHPPHMEGDAVNRYSIVCYIVSFFPGKVCQTPGHLYF